MRITIEKVAIVVPVLMMSCHVSEYPKNEPDIAYTTMVRQHRAKVAGRPAAWAIALARRVNQAEMGPSWTLFAASDTDRFALATAASDRL